mmetsp:Transcript_9410/g.17868  ORF Transcript_9410/g.17868 Transcript_9410/m.17868 type:complete len:216 (+) Transcript_9410:323-970(+)
MTLGAQSANSLYVHGGQSSSYFIMCFTPFWQFCSGVCGRLQLCTCSLQANCRISATHRRSVLSPTVCGLVCAWLRFLYFAPRTSTSATACCMSGSCTSTCTLSTTEIQILSRLPAWQCTLLSTCTISAVLACPCTCVCLLSCSCSTACTCSCLPELPTQAGRTTYRAINSTTSTTLTLSVTTALPVCLLITFLELSVNVLGNLSPTKEGQGHQQH